MFLLQIGANYWGKIPTIQYTNNSKQLTLTVLLTPAITPGVLYKKYPGNIPKSFRAALKNQHNGCNQEISIYQLFQQNDLVSVVPMEVLTTRLNCFYLGEKSLHISSLSTHARVRLGQALKTRKGRTILFPKENHLCIK